jgi:hypothetical protein
MGEAFPGPIRAGCGLAGPSREHRGSRRFDPGVPDAAVDPECASNETALGEDSCGVRVLRGCAGRGCFVDGGPSCARAATHGNRPQMGPNTWLVPTPTLDNPVEIQLGTKARGYHGPGHYPRSAFAQGNGAMDVGPESYDMTSADATASMSVNADGSGSVAFTHVPGDDDNPHRGWHGGISGTIAWTCTS